MAADMDALTPPVEVASFPQAPQSLGILALCVPPYAEQVWKSHCWSEMVATGTSPPSHYLFRLLIILNQERKMKEPL